MEVTSIRIGDGNDWYFTNGDWIDGPDGQVSVVPEMLCQEGRGMQAVHFAFQTALCYHDCTFRFHFCLQGHSDVGIVFRASDEAGFYLLHFPNCGQAYRAQHFWVALSKMDGSGFLRRVGIRMVNRVPSTTGI